MKITRLRHATKEGLKDLHNLLPQLRPHREGQKGTIVELRNIVGNERTIIIVAQDGKHIVGFGSLYVIAKLSGKIGHIEDVVVDSAYRGQGLGEKVMRVLIKEARKQKIESLHLTSRSARVAANKLYQKLGFVRKETNVYRLKL